MKLSELQTGEKGVIVKVLGYGNFRKRIIEMGFVKGKTIEVILNAPLKDPIKYKLLDYEVSLRRNEANLIEVISEKEAKSLEKEDTYFGTLEIDSIQQIANKEGKTINVALVGNPNAGKTSFFNLASNSHEHVGNYSGITVDAKEGHLTFEDYKFNIFDLPGTYSLSAYTPEEIYVRRQIFDTTPDLIINVVSASNLERNLYLTTQLIDMDIPMVIALNMYDELEKKGDKIDYQSLGKMIGVPIVPTIASGGFNNSNNGLKELFETAIRVYEGTEPTVRHIHINHGGDLQEAIDKISLLIKKSNNFTSGIAGRFFAIKLLEKDKEAVNYIQTMSNAEEIFTYIKKVVPHIEQELQVDCESAVINAKYGFIAGALAETYQEGKKDPFRITSVIDPIVTHRFLGYPIFICFMWIMFECTFTIGAYPQEWIDAGVQWLSHFVSNLMQNGVLKDLIVDGIIGGVGGVIVFLPNILILYFFISLMEDSGYLSRAAFIMDKIMHKMGLHGKSFVPLLMGFGCNVPAIMATRTIESKNSRMITMLSTPFMSCSARLPVYVLFAGIFFPKHASLVMLGLYALGMLMAVLSARLFKRFLFKGDDIPFVMELPPYRMPTVKSALHHMWEKSQQYLKKMGSVILVASIIIWALGYFPLEKEKTKRYDAQIQQLQRKLEQPKKNIQYITTNTKETTKSLIATLEKTKNEEHQKSSYIGQIGQFIEPAIRPLGFNWQMGIGIVAGFSAKELVVSTLGVLYTGDSKSTKSSYLSERIKSEKNSLGKPVFTPLVAFGYLIFILLSFPCIATIVAIKNESGSWKWALFSIVYTTTLAWICSFVVYQVGMLF